jgi:predicted ATP-dependent endonuclease of OLD family
MKLEKLEIKGLRRIKNTTIYFGDATFIIGPNNVGKSTIFKAMDLILKNILPSKDDYTMRYDESSNTNVSVVDEIKITATFANIPDEANTWQGFRGRFFIEDGNKKIKYRKSFLLSNTKYELYQQEKKLNKNYCDNSKISINSIIKGGIKEDIVRGHFKNIEDNQNLSVKVHANLLETFYDVWEFYDSYSWVENPGGIPPVIMSKLPKLITIPAEDKSEEIDSSKGSALGEVMNTIFSDVIEHSDNYGQVKTYFSELAKEIDTSKDETEFGKLMLEVNKTIKNVFPDSQIFARVNLSDPSAFLKPNYEIKLGSNILTDVSHQGTGMIRATAFSLLRFREDWRKKRDKENFRNLIICFEEPEIFLHPNAANQMRDTIYELANDENQIICTSHSPYMIDLSRENENQVINNLSLTNELFVTAFPFNVTKEFKNLLDDDKAYVKFLLKIDDYISRVFFCKRVIIVEGDTEDILFRKTIGLLPKEKRAVILSNIQVIKARGKATIAPLVKYLYALGINDIFVIHDKDTGKSKAEQFNPFILSALGDESKRAMLENCVEDILGYHAPSKDKPYEAFKFVESWVKYSDISKKWIEIIEKAFGGYLD